ncbi:ABC transporter ATP-binding protein [Micromonospora sp. WMMD998]|uniref:ABC transporter ATP-binding protein n=1 Tax=Micromonospora sp. WMMD998 TaxID=3016092 RepID=UPI00249C7F8B|nr:ABC transporter ATP-binding protein [Micromonospora sp. WMMD998]WFE40030.1 ABC transporter ATP-binding protein [Micromonospora sp. WMMD998]
MTERTERSEGREGVPGWYGMTERTERSEGREGVPGEYGMTDPAVAVEAREVGRRYGGVWALRECSFRLPAGRIVALVGANGAGKSTLMSIIAGTLAATCGSLLVHGRPVARGRSGGGGAAGSRVAILAQDKPLYRDFSVADMLRFGRSTNRAWDQRRALSWLDRFDIPLDRRCGRLSGGQRAQVALAVALGSRPAVLLLDEPLANLDPVARTEVTGELMAEAADGDMTVMLSTHIIAELSGVGDHLLLLDAGRAVLTGDVDELLGSHVRLTGPRADQPPGPGVIVQARHTDRQSTFVLRQPAAPATHAVVAPGWAAQPLTLDELILTYLRASATESRSLEAVS